MARLITTALVMLLVAPVISAQAPAVPAGGVVNGASFRPAAAGGGGVAPGSIVSIFGTNLAASTSLAGSIPLPTSLAGTSVTIGGATARLFFVSSGQINAQVPWGVAAGNQPLVVTTAAGSSAAATVTVVAAAPGIFSQASNGRGPGTIQNFVSQESQPLNAANVTIDPNGILIIYGTGFGAVNNPPADGNAGGGQRTTTNPTVLVGGRAATVEFSGLAPGFVGLYQVNARVPAGTPDGCFVPVSVAFGSAVSNTVTIAVNSNRLTCNSAASGSPGYYLNASFASAVLSKTTIQYVTPLPVPLPPIKDRFDALFTKYETRLPTVDAGFPPVNGGCITSSLRYDPNNVPEPGSYVVGDRMLNAGTLTLSGPFTGSPRIIPPTQPGTYDVELGDNVLTPGNWTLSGSGGITDVGAFTTNLTIPGPLFSVSSFGVTNGQFRQALPLNLTWTCPDTNGQVIALVTSADINTSVYGTAVCAFSCGAAQGSIASDVLRQLPLSSQGGAQLYLVFAPSITGVGRIQAQGLNEGWFLYTVASALAGATMAP